MAIALLRLAQAWNAHLPAPRLPTTPLEPLDPQLSRSIQGHEEDVAPGQATRRDPRLLGGGSRLAAEAESTAGPIAPGEPPLAGWTRFRARLTIDPRMKTSIPHLLVVTALLLPACDRPDCINQNQVFDQYGIEAAEYKAELAKQVKSHAAGDLRYWIKEYSKDGDSEYLTIHIQGDGLCAQTRMLVTDWTRMEGVREAKGVSYRGAEMAGLILKVQEDSDGLSFVYQDHSHLID